jgi:hypothetical protein
MKIALDGPWIGSGDVSDVSEIVPCEDEIRRALARIVAHPLFARSIKLQSFLTYVVEETLAGRATRLKAYNIATVALGRPESFDPSQDPIVRVEASRLRRALSAYYASEGAQDAVRILMNTGSYQPVFVATGIVDDVGHVATRLAAPSTDGMSQRERFLLGIVVLLFLITFCNTAMLSLTVSKLDELERAMGIMPTATSNFQIP